MTSHLQIPLFIYSPMTHCPSQHMALPHVKNENTWPAPWGFLSINAGVGQLLYAWVGAKGGEAVKLKMPSSSFLIRWWRRRLFGKGEERDREPWTWIIWRRVESGWKGEIGGWKPRGAQVFNAWSSLNGHHTFCPLSPTQNIYVKTDFSWDCSTMRFWPVGAAT